MKQKKLQTVITFFTTDAAFRTESCAQAAGITGRLMPVPRSLTADCGMAFSVAPEREEAVRKLLETEKIEYEAIQTGLF